jgi:DNA-binding transcriptional regulator YiaG
MNKKELQAWLDKYDFTPPELAYIVGVTPGAVMHWLHGERKVPKTLVKLLKYFDKNPNAIREY